MSNLFVEPRPKKPGVKIHLDAPECQQLLDWLKLAKAGQAWDSEFQYQFTKQMARAITDLLKEHPDMLKDRTPEEVEAALKKDQAKITEQLQAMGNGMDWKKVK